MKRLGHNERVVLEAVTAGTGDRRSFTARSVEVRLRGTITELNLWACERALVKLRDRRYVEAVDSLVVVGGGRVFAVTVDGEHAAARLRADRERAAA